MVFQPGDTLQISCRAGNARSPYHTIGGGLDCTVQSHRRIQCPGPGDPAQRIAEGPEGPVHFRCSEVVIQGVGICDVHCPACRRKQIATHARRQCIRTAPSGTEKHRRCNLYQFLNHAPHQFPFYGFTLFTCYISNLNFCSQCNHNAISADVATSNHIGFPTIH